MNTSGAPSPARSQGTRPQLGHTRADVLCPSRARVRVSRLITDPAGAYVGVVDAQHPARPLAIDCALVSCLRSRP